MRSSATARAALPLALLLGGCAAPELAAGTAPLDPVAFFTGDSRGSGTLDPIVGGKAPVSVESRGIRTGDTLTLTQRISEGDKPQRTRVWTIRTLPAGGYLSTLTDAKGPVSVDVRGPRAYLAYTTPSGLRIKQQLALQPDGRTILNRLEAYKFGIRVAVLNETIRK
ncbi:hypothetical protein GGQ97_002673 [Sphingomonas kaistensis]|uniref:DUF3833 family protein n=1 Tax=Sphingomonas kaistensis TaxID=298708 RepID=A0A7X5YAJ8_9SPHN|nr:DUF3833 family protein [Sphingomonas kaistensis]NJC06880.1 hypothetical protein [Sphingomonas kaistensis]